MSTSLQLRDPRGFSLLEMLVAMAVLSVMMVFLFNLVAQTMRAWETGARQVEAAQAARVGLDMMARELQSAFGGVGVASTTIAATTVTNFIPFFAQNNATALWGLPAASVFPATNSSQLFAVGPNPDETNNLSEFGYLCVFVTTRSDGEVGYHNMPGYRYYLLRHAPPSTNWTDFYYRGAVNDNWLNIVEGIGQGIRGSHRVPLIPNCYQISLAFASNNSSGVLSWSTNWPSRTNLPAGVLVTAKVMDEKTAARLEVVKNKGMLTDSDVSPTSTTDAGRILREGTVEVRRFIPFVNNQQ